MIVIIEPIKEGKFLMVRNPKRGWEFPGGKVEEGEDEYKAARRECIEEAGLHLDNMLLVEKNSEYTVFVANIERIDGGEMEWKLFSRLPENLSYPFYEAKRFLHMAGLSI